jgi:plastocyanin
MALARFELVTAIALGLAIACASPAAAPSTAAPAASAAKVTYKDFSVSPTTVEVRVGEAVSWTNGDGTTHTITAGVPGTKSGAFEGRVAGGATTTITMATAGSFDYFCEFHSPMRGKVVVR